MAHKLRQVPGFNGIKISGKELKVSKLSQDADDTSVFCADLPSVEKTLEIVDNVGNLAGLKLNRKKSVSARKMGKYKSSPLQLKWLRSPVKILCIYVSFNENRNKQLN